MFLSNISIKRPIMMTMILLVSIIFGAMAYFKLPMNLFPNADIPYVTVQTIYPGAGPQEVASGVSDILEDEIATVSKIEELKSYSMDNVSLIMIRFELDKDVDIAKDEVKAKVDAVVNDLADGVQLPVVEKFDPTQTPIMQLVVSSDNLSSLELYDLADNRIKDQFNQIEGVAAVNLVGGVQREIKVGMTPNIARQEYFTPLQLAQKLGMANVDIPSGSYSIDGREISVKSKGLFGSLQQMSRSRVATPRGVKQLGQIATIAAGEKDMDTRALFYDNVEKKSEKNVIMLEIVKSSEGNPVQIAKSVKEKIETLLGILPQGTNMKIVKNDADFIEGSVNDTISTLFLGVLFTAIVLLFFLHDLRSTLIVALSMPASLISTFLVMNWMGFSLNMLSLMGLSTSVGVLVSNSVVVIENIFRHMHTGDGRRNASAKGTAEVVVAVVAATMTNIVVFVPIGSMDSLMGIFFQEFAYTVVIATAFSLIYSFTLTPMLASLILPENQKKGKLGESIERLLDKVDMGYGRLLEKIIHTKFRAVMTVFVPFVLLVITIMCAGMLGSDFIPYMDNGEITMDVNMPSGTSMDKTEETYLELQEKVAKFPEVKLIMTKLGSQGELDKGDNLGTAYIKLVDKDQRKASAPEVVEKISRELADYPGAEIKIEVTTEGLGAAVQFNLRGPDQQGLERYKEVIMAKSRDIQGLVNFKNSIGDAKLQVELRPKRKMLQELGIDIATLGSMVRASIQGLTPTQYDIDGDKYDIRVSYTEESVNSLGKIESIPIVTSKGVFVLSQLAEVSFTSVANKIIHDNRINSIQFTGANADGSSLSEVVSQVQQMLADLDLPAEYTVAWGGNAKEMQTTMTEMMKAGLLAIVLTYMLLAAILESFIQPLYILATLPLAAIGVIWSLILAGLSLNIVTMMSMIMLIGIVVNAAILLLDYTNQLKASGLSPRQALLQACPIKLRPVIMSAIAIALGMLPMAMGIGDAGAEMRIGMGVVSIGGLLVATLLTLFVIPAIYFLLSHRVK